MCNLLFIYLFFTANSCESHRPAEEDVLRVQWVKAEKLQITRDEFTSGRTGQTASAEEDHEDVAESPAPHEQVVGCSLHCTLHQKRCYIRLASTGADTVCVYIYRERETEGEGGGTDKESRGEAVSPERRERGEMRTSHWILVLFCDDLL